MENNAMDDKNPVGDEEEEIPKSFVCCLCLELIYKPIVLSCGHISCFWCVHKSMSGYLESRCPICRHPYYHFPTICQTLHFLLLKMYPVAYKRRGNQTLEEEKIMGVYSPQFEADACGLRVQFDHPSNLSSVATLSLSSDSSMEPAAHMDHKQDEGTMHSQQSSDKSPEVTEDLCVEGKNVPEKEHLGQLKISLADVMCIVCKQLLFHPVVLNCGHVYCEACVFQLADEMLRCQVCQSPHPKGFPKVCLQLDHFLEEQFPEEYAQQKDAVHLGQINVTPEAPLSCSSEAGNEGKQIGSLSDPALEVHFGVGCDFCGICPIIGNRYRCQDCKEQIGFDLCNDCYNSGSKLPGRFNQQHSSDHKFEQVPGNKCLTANSSGPCIQFLRANFSDITWMGVELEGSSFESESLENSELGFEDPTLSDNGEENQNRSAPH